ncbi:MAG: glycosyltransferase family 4 protein [Phycisphaerae bacterium]|nr:glycosyltransferase family 4 protein [Phycisphaerae bacterium]
MRVLVVTPSYPSRFLPYEGVFVEKQVEALRDSGMNVDVVHVSRTHLWPISAAIPIASEPAVCRMDERGNTFIHIPARTLPRLAFYPDALFRLINHRVNRKILSAVERLRPDVLHFHWGRTAGYGWLAMQRHPEVARVVTTHGGCTRHSRHHRFYRHSMIRSFREADKVILVSPTLAEHAAMLGFDDSNFEIVGNGIDERIIRVKTDYWSPGMARPFRVSSVGALIPLKAHDDTIRAVGMLVDRGYDVRLDIVGDGPEKPRLQAIINELKLADRTKLHGSLPNSEALEVIRASDVMCLPSWNEGFGVVYLEALAQSVSAISCRGQGFEHLMIQSQAGFVVDSHSPQEVAACIERLVVEPGLAAAMGERGRTFVQDGQTLRHKGQEIVAVYERAIEAAKHRCGGNVLPGKPAATSP